MFLLNKTKSNPSYLKKKVYRWTLQLKKKNQNCFLEKKKEEQKQKQKPTKINEKINI